MKNKYKIILIIVGFLLIIITTVLISFIFIKDEETKEIYYYPINKVRLEIDNEKNISENNNSQVKNDQDNNIKLNKDKIDFAEIVNNKIYYYSKEKESYNKIEFKNKKISIDVLISNFSKINNIRVSPNEKYLLYRNISTGIFSIYNFENKKKNNLNKYIDSVVWFQEDSTVIGSYSNYPSNNINKYKWQTGEREELTNLYINNAIVLDSNPNKLLYIRNESWNDSEEVVQDYEVSPDPAEMSYVNLFSLDKNSNIYQWDDIQMAKFSKDGTSILASKNSSSNFPRLVLINSESLKENPINLSTYFNKVEFTNDPNIIIYAKVEEFSGANSKDTLWKMNIKTGNKIQLTKLEDNISYDISNIMISSDNKKIYFINQYDKKLYQVNIE